MHASVMVEILQAHKECCRNISILREVSKYFGTRDPLRKYMDIVEDQVDLELEAELFSRELGSYPEMAGSHAPTCAYDFKLDQEDLEFEYADAHQLGLLRRDVRKAQEGKLTSLVHPTPPPPQQSQRPKHKQQ